VLQQSLIKKESEFDNKLNLHFETVKEANGQPLNDKRNGRATLDKWERQNDALRNLKEGIEKTKNAIEREEDKIANIENANSFIPREILSLVENGELVQWRKHPTTFFVAGVEKARIVWDEKRKVLAHRYVREVADKEQYSKFAKTFNSLNAALNRI
jgi:hypothetical protein